MENFEPSNEQIDALNAAVARNTRVALCNGSVDFFEQMTKATTTGCDEIRRRESEGSLASVMVARSDRRPKTNNG